jgi:hypothetical protein
VSAVHDRWELVEPLLFAHALRDLSAFQRGTTKRSHNEDLEALRREHRFEDTAIARAFNLLADASPSPLDRDGSRDEPLHSAIRETAARWLVADGDHWALRIETRRPGHEIIRWRGVTMLVPPSIVVAGALSTTERSHPCWVQALPDSIAPREPIGHLHLHLGPMLPFEALWIQLWNVFLQRGTLDARKGDGIASLKEKDVPEIGRHASKRQPGMRWQWILELAFAARVWLLQDGSTPFPSVLRAFSRGHIDLERRTGALLSLWSQKSCANDLDGATDSPPPLRGNRRIEEWRDRARREARLLSESRVREDRRRRTLQNRALVADTPMNSTDVAMSAPNDGDDEVVFLAEAFRRCSESENESYARVFYQYLRVKVALYRSLVVDPWTVGLRHFLDVVQRDKPYAKVINDDRRLDDARLDAVRTEKPLRVDALEIHIPPARWIEQGRQAPHPHTWVLSFVRAKLPKDDAHDGTLARKQWRRATAEAATTCRFLARCMAMRPLVLREIRGIGLMHWERNGPVWLFETAFRRLIDASAEVAAGHPRLHLRPIHTAFHLGEDFDHLLSGLRQIFEPFEWGLIRRGDRIGHVLALGLSPGAWCEQNPWVRMRPWDRILDIGFLYWAFESLDLSLPADALERMRVNAGEAVRQVFDRQYPDPLETARNLWLSLPRLPPNGSNRVKAQTDRLAEARSLKELVLDNPSVGRRALALTLTVETKHDLPVLKAVQDAVHERVAKWQVAVEVNPSSNLLVGGFRSIFRQPVFHTDHLPITLNADDPLTFATTLADEYAYAWAGMVIGSGQSPDQATRRLEEAARCSMRYVFTERRGVEAPGKR